MHAFCTKQNSNFNESINSFRYSHHVTLNLKGISKKDENGCKACHCSEVKETILHFSEKKKQDCIAVKIGKHIFTVIYRNNTAHIYVCSSNCGQLKPEYVPIYFNFACCVFLIPQIFANYVFHVSDFKYKI